MKEESYMIVIAEDEGIVADPHALMENLRKKENIIVDNIEYEDAREVAKLSLSIDGRKYEVWLHSHGLKRCGMHELEILGSNKAMYNVHYNVLENMAYRMIEADAPYSVEDPVFLGRVGQGFMVTTAINWEDALEYYEGIELGTNEDRDEYHSKDTCPVMCYLNPDDMDNKVFTKVQYFDELLRDNPMFYISEAETKRMSDLATERIEYLKKGFSNKENRASVKIGLVVDKEYWGNDDPESNKEHIWFDVVDFKDDKIVARLSQEPYYVSGIKKGDTKSFDIKAVTDWIVITKDKRITPDDAYLL